jgi:hypothetical protein
MGPTSTATVIRTILDLLSFCYGSAELVEDSVAVACSRWPTGTALLRRPTPAYRSWLRHFSARANGLLHSVERRSFITVTESPPASLALALENRTAIAVTTAAWGPPGRQFGKIERYIIALRRTNSAHTLGNSDSCGDH